MHVRDTNPVREAHSPPRDRKRVSRFGHENAVARQLKALLAAADFSRIRNADLGRFTLDRLMSILNRLGSRVEVRVKVKHTRRDLDQILGSLNDSVYGSHAHS